MFVLIKAKYRRLLHISRYILLMSCNQNKTIVWFVQKKQLMMAVQQEAPMTQSSVWSSRDAGDRAVLTALT